MCKSSLVKILLMFSFTSLLINNALSQELYFVEENNILYKENGSGCSPELVVDINSFFSDISFHPNGELYGIRGNGNLYQVDISDGGIDLIYVFEGTTYNSLVVSDTGIFFTIGSNGQLRSYDLSTGTETFYGVVEAQPGGDLTFINGELYLGENGGRISKLDLDDVSNIELVFSIEVPGSIIGLSSARISCDSVVLYATLSGIGSGGSAVYEIDLTAQDFNLVCDLPFLIKGSAMKNEFAGSREESEVFNLDSITYQILTCDSIIGDIQLNTSYGVGEIHYTLDNSLFSSDGVFANIEPGIHFLEGIDEIGCTISEAIELLCNDVVNSTAIMDFSIPHNIYPNPSTGTFIVETQGKDYNKVAIVDVQGKEIDFILTKGERDSYLELNCDKPGLYFIRIDDLTYKVICR